MSINEIDYIDDLGAAGVLALTHKLVVAATGSKVLKVTTLADVLTALALTASLIANVPAGNIAATNVQAAINELDSEKLALAGGQMTGALGLAAGSVGSPGIYFLGDATSGLSLVVAGQIAYSSLGAQVFTLGPTGLNTSIAGGGTSQSNIFGEGTTQISINRYGSASGGSVNLSGSRGTIAAGTVSIVADQLGNLNYRGQNGTPGFTTGIALRGVLTETGAVGSAAMGSRWTVLCCPIGSGALGEMFRVESATGISVGGANVVIDQNRVFRPRSYTVATVPTVTATGIIHVSDEGGGQCLAFADGTNWRRLRDRKIIATTNTSTVEFEGSVAANIQSLVPLTGFSQAIPNDCRTYVVAPAGTIAAGTLTMPSAPRDGQQLTLCTTQIITGLTMNAAGGQTLLGGLTASTANGFASWTYKASTTTWYRSG